MPAPIMKRSGESSHSIQGQLPFANDNVDEADFDAENAGSLKSDTAARHRKRSPSITSGTFLSSSYTGRTPARSFFHHASHGAADVPQYSSVGVREKTQELAGLALADPADLRAGSASRGYGSETDTFSRGRSTSLGYESNASRSFDSVRSDVIDEQFEPASPETITPGTYPTPRIPSTANTHSEAEDDDTEEYFPRGRRRGDTRASRYGVPNLVVSNAEQGRPNESAPLIPKGSAQGDNKNHYGTSITGWSHAAGTSGLRKRFTHLLAQARDSGVDTVRTVTDPHNWNRKAMAGHGVASIRMLSAVFLGLLLNILDGLSYGLILFPLGEDIFAKTGPDGISIFFLSCIVSQVVYSIGFSIFKGGVGSEMIEVVPFFHKMAYLILGHMGTDNPDAVLATVIVSYAASSVLTGLIFLGLGLFKLGNLVSFFPRSILTGCIGGVGFFLVVTGIEVSARLDGNLEYNLVTLKELFQRDTVFLWLLPLTLAIFIVLIRHFFKSPLILPIYFIAIGSLFYLIVKGFLHLDLDLLRHKGWIFEQPESGIPFYHFYSYFSFKLVDWAALAKTIPTMFALSFFGIIHVPINVPALGVAVQEDDVNINRELIAHGISNAVSGFVGSIQNYLVYANSILFIRNGGDNRTAGLLLAVATTAVWMAGPAMIGFIPVNVVGTLIFMLGIELLEEAVWDTFGKLHRLEYLTIIAIVLIMGVYDFVVGIVAGIVLACLNYVVQTSRTRSIRATYSGEIASSTVRRPVVDRRYLKQVRSQIRVEKLSGYLFFGTIVGVENSIRSLIDEETFNQRPIRYVIVDFFHVTGIDFSAAEAFTRMNRILRRRNVKMILSSVSFSDDVGKSLNMVGLLDQEQGDEECPPPQVYEDLNQALEACENDLLEPFYKHRGAADRKANTPPISISPSTSKDDLLNANSLQPAFQSPRRGLLFRAAESTLAEHGPTALQSENNTLIPSKWTHFSQPTKIMLQTFADVSDKNEDFWHRAAPYFVRRQYTAGNVLYNRGDEPDGFFLLEKGRFRAEYDLEQGSYQEVILPGTTCGELPFFSETDRTGSVVAERESTAWLLTREKWREMEGKEKDLAMELLRVGLKLTRERMDAVTSYVLVTAS